MASFMDFFNGTASPEQRASLAGFASQFNNALGDGRRPVNFGAALAAGAQGMQQGRNEYQDRQSEQEAVRQMMALRALQLRGAQGDADAADRQRSQEAAITAAAQGSVGADGAFDQAGFLGRVRSINALKAMELERAMAKAAPEYDTTPQWVNGPDGKPVLMQLSKTAAPRVLDGFKPRDKADIVNLGGTSVAVNPYDLKPGQTFARTMTPGESARIGIDRQQLGISQQRLALDRESAGGGKAPPGYRWAAGGSLEAIPGGPADTKSSKEAVQKVQDARDVLSILDEAEPLLSKSTSSYLGAAVDQGARAFGVGTDGGEAAAQLKVLQGLLVSKMPKMSGPQSDKDVQLYREMAGQIGDSTLPEATRRAAATTIRSLNQKYIDGGAGGGTPAPPPAGAVNMLKMNPRLREQFDAKYGAGAAASILGK